MKKKLGTILIIIVTIGCIYMGIHTRKTNGIVVTKIATNTENAISYMIETSKNNIVMIDGGNYDDAEHLTQLINAKGGIVDQWFITLAHPENFGAMQKIIEDGKIEINHIYISFNGADWYAENEPENYTDVKEFLDLIYSDEIIAKVYNVPLKYELLVDNLYFTVLNVANTELNGGYNQSMAIKVNNTYKSMIFMGNIAGEAAYKIKDNTLDEMDCDAVQISNNNVSDEIYELMTPNYVFTEESSNTNHIVDLVKSEYLYGKTAQDVTVKIW